MILHSYFRDDFYLAAVRFDRPVLRSLLYLELNRGPYKLSIYAIDNLVTMIDTGNVLITYTWKISIDFI